MSTTTPRPRTVTWACLIAGFASVVMLVNLVTVLSGWAPQELRDQVESIIEEPPLAGYELSLSTVLEWLRIAMMIASAAAVAAIILAIHTARRHRGARIGLTVVAVLSGLLFLTTGLVGIIPVALAAACVGLLWSREANDWFNPERVARRATQPAQPARPAFAPPDGPRPAEVPFGTEPGAQPQPPFGQPGRAIPPSAQWPRQPSRTQRNGVPGVVLAAVLTATLMSAVIVVVGLVVIATYGSAPADLGSELLSYPTLRDNAQIDELGWTAAGLGRAVVYSAAGMLVLSLAAIAAALLMLRRSNAARIILVVLSGITIAVAVAGTLAGIPWLAAAIAVIILLFRPSANAYFQRQGERG